MKKYLLLMVMFLFSATTVFAEPASLSFDPVNIKAKTGDTINVSVNIFTGNQDVASTDIWIKYNAQLLEPLPDKTTPGDMFPSVDTKIIAPGTLYVYGVQQNKTSAQPLTGTVATISFKALKEGSFPLEFDCASYKKGQTSQIIKADNSLTDIISCPATLSHSASVTIEPGSSVLGVNAQKDSIGMGHIVGGIVVAFLTLFLYIKYHRLNKHP